MKSLQKNIKWLIGICMVLVAIIYVEFYISSKNFQSILTGEIIFLQRDEGNLNVYAMTLPAGEPKLIFKNPSTNVMNKNSLYPRWTQNGNIVLSAILDKQNEYEEISEMGPWQRIEVDQYGKIVKRFGFNNSLSTIPSRENDLYVENGDIFLPQKNDVNKKIYDFYGYHPDLNRGAEEVSWSDDKKFIIFASCPWFRSCGIYVSDITGKHIVRITDGTDPDWRQ